MINGPCGPTLQSSIDLLKTTPSSENQNINVYDHLCDLLCTLLNGERDMSAYDNFEQLSYELKEKRQNEENCANKHNDSLKESCNDDLLVNEFADATARSLSKIFREDKESVSNIENADNNENNENSIIKKFNNIEESLDLISLSNNFSKMEIEWLKVEIIGLGDGSSSRITKCETTKKSSEIRKNSTIIKEENEEEYKQTDNEDDDTHMKPYFKFWGKILGLENDYYIAERSGLCSTQNTIRYFVKTYNNDWVELPSYDESRTIEVSRSQIILTGSLDFYHRVFPAFEGTEAEYLRGLIDNIAIENTIAPKGYFKMIENLNEDEEEFINDNKTNNETNENKNHNISSFITINNEFDSTLFRMESPAESWEYFRTRQSAKLDNIDSDKDEIDVETTVINSTNEEPNKPLRPISSSWPAWNCRQLSPFCTGLSQESTTYLLTNSRWPDAMTYSVFRADRDKNLQCFYTFFHGYGLRYDSEGAVSVDILRVPFPQLQMEKDELQEQPEPQPSSVPNGREEDGESNNGSDAGSTVEEKQEKE